MKIAIKNRWQAFGVHLLISFFIFAALTAIILFLWYPDFLFLYDGGLQGMKLIAGVDFLIGPVLTLFVYKLGKKTLRFDLICIAFLQLACLVGGMWTIWQTRPIAIVYATGSFHVINKQGYENESVNPFEMPILAESRWPVWVGVSQPVRQNYSRIEWAMMAYRLAYSPELYIPYEDALVFLKEDGVPYEEVSERLGTGYSEKDFPDYVRFYMVITSLSDGLLAIDTRTGEVVNAFF